MLNTDIAPLDAAPENVVQLQTPATAADITPPPVTEAIDHVRAAELVGTLDRAELLRFGAAMFLRAHQRDGLPGAEVQNRNALLMTRACLDRLLHGLSAV